MRAEVTATVHRGANMVIPDANTAAGPLMVKLHWMDGTFMPDASNTRPRW